jgi:hypothetical protein
MFEIFVDVSTVVLELPRFRQLFHIHACQILGHFDILVTYLSFCREGSRQARANTIEAVRSPRSRERCMLANKLKCTQMVAGTDATISL